MQKPSAGWICLNVDAALPNLTKAGSVGGVFRDSEGNWLYGFHKSIGITDVLQAEPWGLLVGLDLAHSLDIELFQISRHCRQDGSPGFVSSFSPSVCPSTPSRPPG
ncbi:hypothetical protein F3Y22_tig00002847pilonHSYRG00096 [Hibiscus syriacus]|uniref:RNase H type-1 domain-containing protein n=1 Tax=Hibiscus syriacus TaxID=106335 RepID=A0A6A3CN50_HIBSY|nr:hypothetical protein F3Y22_tig00002847pilonHSYRG00096 [Hibiscus syriacus]